MSLTTLRCNTGSIPLDGVYKSGFATTQSAYQAAVKPLFESLDRVEKILEGKDYLIGDQLTEADVRLFPTIASISFAPHPRTQIVTMHVVDSV
jgi:glutathionyl-hydroquinone reductase